VGWSAHDTDDSDHAAHLVRRTALAESIATLDTKPVLHGDNGSTLKAITVLAMLNWLGVKPSYSRPRVSDDNACAQARLRTAKFGRSALWGREGLRRHTSIFAALKAFASMKFLRGSTSSPISIVKTRSASMASSICTLSRRRTVGSIVVSHNWLGFISPRPL
jgi:transposase InsO family protein